MGNPVTLDSDDVEVLLNAAAAARKIEDILAAIRQDPAMIRLQAKGAIGDALDRVNKLRGQAIRDPDTQLRPPIGWLPTVEQLETLDRLYAAGGSGIPSSEIDSYERLRACGLVVAGQVNEYIIWGDKTSHARALGFQRFKLTELGVSYMKGRGL
jgi:hypothetical protein